MVTNEENSNILSEYELKGTLGKGTFSEVKLGINKYSKEKVAIKILEKTKINQANDYSKINREIHMLKTFFHMNIIKTKEIKENEKNIYIIMEYCKYGELFNHIIQRKKLSEKESSFFYYQLINGLEYIHSNGIVHRDLKPENLLITKGNILKIIDFGLSNFFSGENLLKTPCGSPCYASPEMVSGKKYNGFYIDIWSTGIILFAMLCGFLPFEDENNSILFKKIEECKIDYPNFISKNAKNLLKKILVNDPNKRIKISEIKKHSFYLKGKENFKKIHPELFMEEIIIPNEIGIGNLTERNGNSDNLFDDNKRSFTQGKTNYDNIKLNKEKGLFEIKPLKINFNLDKIKKNYHPYEFHTSHNKNINKDNLLKNLEKLINSNSKQNLEKQSINNENNSMNTIEKTNTKNFLLINENDKKDQLENKNKSNNKNNISNSNNYYNNSNISYGKDNKRDFSNDSTGEKKRFYPEQNALKKYQYLELSDKKEESKYRPITTRDRITKIDYREMNHIKNIGIFSNRNPTNFELYGNDFKKNKGFNYYSNNKYNSLQQKLLDNFSKINSYSNNQYSANLTEKYISNSLFTMNNSSNHRYKKVQKNNNHYMAENTALNVNMFHPNYYRYFKHNNDNKKNPIESITSKKINDLYESKEINNKNNNLISKNTKKSDGISDHETKNDTQINVNTKKIIPKNYNINDFTKFFKEEKKIQKKNDNINSKKENLVKNMNKNKENNSSLKSKNQKHKKKNNNNQINNHLLNVGNSNAYKKMNTAIDSLKFDSKILELTYALKNLKNQNMKKSKNIK